MYNSNIFIFCSEFYIKMRFQQGRQFGLDGNLAEWWVPTTKKNFVERAKCIISQYGNYSFPELGLNVTTHFFCHRYKVCNRIVGNEQINGINTQGENIADNGGIKEAYRAYIKHATRQSTGNENWDHVEQRLPGLSKFKYLS